MLRWIENFSSLVVCATALIFIGCGGESRTEERARLISVETIVVGIDSCINAAEYVGVVEEDRSVALSFAVSGTVDRIDVREGDRITKGQILARLGTETLQSAYDGAQATLRQAEDAMERLQLLYDSQSLPEIKYVEAQTRLEQARSAERIAAKNLKDCEMVASISGVVGRRMVEPGENVAPGQTVLTLLDIGKVKIRVSVPEKEIGQLARGDEATIVVGALDGQTFNGRIVEKGVEANPLAHTYEVRIGMDNPKEKLMPGMVCRVQMHRNASTGMIVLPSETVQMTGRGQRFVWCVRDGRAERVDVTVGALTDNGVVITDGLEEGDEVITSGYQKVSSGMKVEVL